MKKFSAIAQAFILTSFSFSALSFFAVAPVQAASFIGLGDFIVHNPFYKPSDDNRNYYNSSANGVSADGSVVVGSSFDVGYRVYMDSYSGFRWTQKTGQVNCCGINNGISANGSVIVGSILGNNSHTYPIPPFPPYDPNKAFRWTQETGDVDLGNLGNNSRDSSANTTSADGSVVVGFSGNANGYSEAFRWTQETGMVGLSSLGNSEAKGVSADGSIIIGSSNGQAFRWTQETGMMGLGSLIGNSSANGVSADGSVIIGASNGQGFRWTQSTGMVSLKETLDLLGYND